MSIALSAFPRMRLALPGRVLACALAVSVTLTGCAQQQLGPNATAVERANANFTQTVATGAVAGALAGAALGAIFGRNAQSAAIGAGAGAALGTGAGYLVARNNEQQAATEDTLQGQIQSAQIRAQAANDAAAEARRAADQARAQSRTLAAQYKAGQISASQYRSQLAESQRYGQQVQTLLGNMDRQEASLRQQIAAAGTDAGPLRQSLAQIQASHRSLQNSYNEINAATAAVPQA